MSSSRLEKPLDFEKVSKGRSRWASPLFPLPKSARAFTNFGIALHCPSTTVAMIETQIDPKADGFLQTDATPATTLATVNVHKPAVTKKNFNHDLARRHQPDQEKVGRLGKGMRNISPRFIVWKRMLAAIPCLFAAIAFVCSYVGNFYCDNIIFEPNVPEGENEGFYAARPQSFGLWMYRKRTTADRLNGEVIYTEECVGYPEYVEVDTAWKVARAFSCLGIIIAGFLILWQFCAPFLLFDSVYWRWAMAIFAFIGTCQGLTLQFVMSDACQDNPMLGDLTFNSSLYPEHCSWSFGTRASLMGCIMWFVTVLALIVIPAPGIRPSERKFPMMVWDDDDVSEGDGVHRYDDCDDDSIASFAFDECDLDDISKEESRQPNLHEDMTETEVSESGNDEFLYEETGSVSDLSTLGASSSGSNMKNSQQFPL